MKYITYVEKSNLKSNAPVLHNKMGIVRLPFFS